MESYDARHRLLCVLLGATGLVAAACSDDERSSLEDAGRDGSTSSDAGRDGSATEADASDDGDGGAVEGDGGGGEAVEGDTYAITSSRRLISFERATGSEAASVDLSGLADGEDVLGADFRPSDGALYVLSSAGKLYTVDLDTGVLTQKSALVADAGDTTDAFSALAGDTFGVDFNPVADRLRVVSSGGQNLRINVDTGATTTDGPLSPLTPGVSAAGYTNSFASACRTRLYVIDGATKKLKLQDPPNDGVLTDVGDLGDVGDVTSFDIVTGSDGSNAALIVANREGALELAQVDLSTGAATPLSSFTLEDGESVVTLALPPPATAPTQARGELLGLTTGNRLVSFNRAAPAKLCTSADVSGLGNGESLLGADIRPLDGTVYGLTNQGRLYTLAADGAATLKSTLSADPADTTDAFSALLGSDFGVGFNPVPDRLRVVSASGQNLRINVDSGATFTDAALSPVGSSLTAAAYTNSFAGAKSTTLYGIDSAANTLVRVGGSPANSAACPDAGNPNCGVVSTIGALNIGEISALDGFDIDAVQGTALAALSIGDATTSGLYSIDLGTGAATALGATIGGGQRLLGLMFAAAPALTAFATTSDGKLLVFAPNAPSTPTRSVALSGLQSGETLLGIDVRPLDGKLYAVGSSGRLYTLDTTSGAVTLVATLTASGGAAVSLPSGTFALDFNPAADALRLVASSGENYRILPSARTAGAAGTTFVDTALNPGTPSVTAGAYTNSFVGTTSTSLYVVDGSTLALQGGLGGTPSPNGGLLTPVGGLGITPVGGLSLDIAGGHNGLAFAAVSLDGANTALYSVNLTSGVATAFNAANNTLAVASGATVTGVALSLR